MQTQHVKVSGSSAGTVGQKKKDGYAGTQPPDFVVATKVGKTNHQGYSGPNIAKQSRTAHP